MSTDKIENEDKAEQKVSKDELSEKELEKATGGRSGSAPSVSEIVITKPTDVAST
jgi:hypothetical protein